MSAVSAEAPLLLQAARGTMLSFSSDSTCYMGNLNSKSNFLFSENKLLETIFFVAVFLFFTCHSISHEIKTVIWMTEKYTLLSYYNNDFTPSKKAVQQLSDIKFLTSEMTDNDCANTKLHSRVKEKKFQVNQLQITFS